MTQEDNQQKIVLAPMEGIGNHVYRNAFRRHYGGVDRYYTPFLDLMSDGGMKNRGKNDILPENNRGIDLIPQVLSQRAEAVQKAAERLSGEYGYTEININMGCPYPTVVKKGRGAGLLADPDGLRRFLDTLFEEAVKPGQPGYSVKTRIGMEHEEEAETLLSVFNDYPLRELIVHPRLQKEFYEGAIHDDVLRLFYENSKNPLCLNPGIRTVPEYEAFRKKYPGAKAFMIGRGLLTDPSLAEKIKHSVTSENLTAEAPECDPQSGIRRAEESTERFISFHDDLLESWQRILSGDTPVLFKIKEMWAYWQNTIGPEEKLLKKIKKAKTIAEYRGLAGLVFQELRQHPQDLF